MVNKFGVLAVIGLLILTYGIVAMPYYVDDSTCLGYDRSNPSGCAEKIPGEKENPVRMPVLGAGAVVSLIGGTLYVGDRFE